jgi:hypothetical protein
VSWIWSDELAAAAEAEGIDGPQVASWRRHLVALPREPGRGANELVRLLLGTETSSRVTEEAPSSSTDETSRTGPRCTCGGPDATKQVLGLQQTAG